MANDQWPTTNDQFGGKRLTNRASAVRLTRLITKSKGCLLLLFIGGLVGVVYQRLWFEGVQRKI